MATPVMNQPIVSPGPVPSPTPTPAPAVVYNPAIHNVAATTNNCVQDVNNLFTPVANAITSAYGNNIPDAIANAYNSLYNSAMSNCNAGSPTTFAAYASKADCQTATYNNYVTLRDSQHWTNAQLDTITNAYYHASKACDKLADITGSNPATGFTVSTPTTGGNVIQSTTVANIPCKTVNGVNVPIGCTPTTTSPSWLTWKNVGIVAVVVFVVWAITKI